jgi:hypothetical protein
MIWLLEHPLPPTPLLSVSFTGETEKERKVADGRIEGKWVVEEPSHTTARKPGPL